MAEIRCPMCSKPNPEGSDVCQYCQARLTPLEAPSSNAEEYKPGDVPTPKATSELEPVLPKWLQQARQEGRESAAEMEQELKAKEVPPPKQTDRLARLKLEGSKQDSNEKIPDWLSDLRPELAEEEEPEEQEEPEAELTGDMDLSAFSESPAEPEIAPEAEMPAGESNLPGWLSSLADQGPEEQRPASDEGSALDRLGQPGQVAPESSPAAEGTDDFLSAFSDDSSFGESSDTEDTPFETELPDWLGGGEPAAQASDEMPQLGLDSQETGETSSADDQPFDSGSESELPDWTQGRDQGGTPETAQPFSLEGESPDAFSAGSELPDWISSGDDSPAAGSEGITAAGTEELPDWISSSPEGSESADTPPQESGTQRVDTSELEIPDWINSSTETESSASKEDVQPPRVPTSELELPDWLNTTEGTGSEAASGDEGSEKPRIPTSELEMPDWISQSGKSEAEAAPQGDDIFQVPGEPSTDTPTGELPDWLAAAAASDEPAGELPPMGDGASMGMETEAPQAAPETAEPASAAFVSPGEPAGEEGEIEDIFSVDVPDWLSGIDADQAGGEEGQQAAAGQADDDLSPVNLPSWVQAMRPVESAIPDAPMEDEQIDQSDQFLEKEGPLAGLSGVLPAAPPGFSPSSKPKAYSIKLQADEGQQSHAALLDKVLEAENKPEALSTSSIRYSQRMLRWILTGIILFITIVSLAFNVGVTPLPRGGTKEINFYKLIGSLPEQAPVLVIIDYEAAYAGEMEAITELWLEKAMLLKHIRITLISTNPTGPALAENLMEKANEIKLSDGQFTSLQYTNGNQYTNLGYIPGGTTGIHSFVNQPGDYFQTMVNELPAKDTAPLVGVQKISDFTVILLLTSSSDSGQIWIEQASPVIDSTPLLVVGSAQSEPILMPYFASGQVTGMINGLQGNIQDRSPFWEAYSFGLLTASGLIVAGSIWSLFQAYLDRRKKIGFEE